MQRTSFDFSIINLLSPTCKWVRDLMHMYHVPVVGKSSPRAFSQGELGRLESGMTLGCVGLKF